jgi:hypothetical protein
MPDNKKQEEAAFMELVDSSIVTSSRGITAHFKPLPPFMRELIGQQMETEGHKRGEIPTYEVETFGGEFETHMHDKTTIEGDVLAEAAWAEYKADKQAWEVEYNQRLFNLCIVRCMEIDQKIIDDPGWSAGQEFLKIEIPEDPIGRKVHFVRTEYIGNQEDYLMIITKPFELAVSQTEIAAAAERMFRALKVEKDDATDGAGSVSSEEELDVAGGSDGSSSDVSETGDSE